MNNWQLHGVIKKRPVLNYEGNIQVLNFSIANTEPLKYEDGRPAKPQVTWVSCSIRNPSQEMLDTFLEKTLVFLQGTPEVVKFKRDDGTSGYGLGIVVTSGYKMPEKGSGSVPGASTGTRAD